MLLLLLACTDANEDTAAPADDTSSDTSSDTSDTDTDVPVVSPTFVLCGGGEEGDADDPTAWSAVYAQGLAAGDVSGDGLVRVAVLSTGEETEWIPEYLVFLGADEAFNLRVGTRDAADDATLADTFAAVDAVFLKGGDQGEYYDKWNETALEAAIRSVVARGGGVIGTSAGAMSQSAFALAGSADYVSADVLADSQSEFLDDVSDGGSGVHTDFFDFVPGVLVDTHFVTRARLGRLVGAMARVVDDGAGSPVGIGLDEQTCITVHEGAAQVTGLGSATFVRPSVEAPVRVAGQPLDLGGPSGGSPRRRVGLVARNQRGDPRRRRRDRGVVRHHGARRR